MTDLISRQAAIDAILHNQEVYSNNFGNDPIDRYTVAIIDNDAQTIAQLPTIEAEPVKHGRWIPVSERLPEEDTEVLISYRYKEGEGDTSHVDIDITTYGQMYFGGNKVGNNKHWRAPFEYFYSNYEVIAWMPLPKPYKEEAETEYEP